MNFVFALNTDRLTPQNLNQNKNQSSAIQGGEGKQVQNRNIYTKESNKIEKREVILGQDKERVVKISVTPVVGAGNKILGRLIILHDVTRERAMEKMKSEFVNIVAHQLRTPLSAIKWTMRLVLDGDAGPISKEQEEILQKGYQSNERMINLVADLLNAARVEEGRFIYEFIETDFSLLIGAAIETVKSFAQAKKVSIVLDKGQIGFIVKADKEKLELAVQNLIDNAINYSPAESVVTISILCDKMNVACAIKDNGIGIPLAVQSRIFDKFFRAPNAVKMETQGSGIGLFIARNIIESHGGKIWFKSEENKGTTFYFSLPLFKNI